MEFETACYIIGAILFLEIAIGVAMLAHGVDKILDRFWSLEIQHELTHQVLTKMTRNESEIIDVLEKLNVGCNGISKHLDKIHGELLQRLLSGLDEEDMDDFLKQLRDDFAPDSGPGPEPGQTDGSDWDLDSGPIPG